MLDIQTVQNKKITQPVPKTQIKPWFVNSDGDIADGEHLIAEPSYLSRDGYKNAALIAAAPELLAALELLASELFYPNTNGAIRQSSPANHKRLLETATAAIAKARG